MNWWYLLNHSKAWKKVSLGSFLTAVLPILTVAANTPALGKYQGYANLGLTVAGAAIGAGLVKLNPSDGPANPTPPAQ